MVTSTEQEKRLQIMKSQDFYWTAKFAEAFLIAGWSFENEGELIDKAIALKNQLILKMEQTNE